MTSQLRTYRHELTGEVKQYHPRVASVHPQLIEVPEGTKPLAYTPIPQAAIAKLRSERARAGSAGDAELKDKNPEADAPATQDEE